MSSLPLHRRLLRLPLLLLVLASVVVSQRASAAPRQIDGVDLWTPVAPGVQLTTFTHYNGRGPVHGQILTVDLTNPNISTDLLTPGPLAAAAPLSAMAAQRGAVAAINGDFFDMYQTNAPYGSAVAGGQLLKGPIFSWTRVAGVGADGLGRLSEMFLHGTVKVPEGDFPLIGLNQHNLSPDGIAMYTTAWGGATRSRAVEKANSQREVLVTNGVVVASSDRAGAGWIAPDSFVLLGREAGAGVLERLPIGSPVSVTFAPSADVPAPYRFALGGKEVLLRDGQIPDFGTGAVEPRSAVGFSADGHTMFLVAVDGRRGDSSGMTLRELAELLLSLGADDALNLDGGGSSTLLARKPGEWGPELINRPSGGSERPIPNGIGIFVRPGSGQLAGFRITPVLGDGADRVFAGLSRTLVAKGFDETYAPAAAGDLQWASQNPEIGAFEPGGVFRGIQPGVATVQVRGNGANGTKEGLPRPIFVLPLSRLEIHSTGLDFGPGAGPSYVAVMGFAPDGYAAQVEPRDVQFGYDPSILDVVPLDQKHVLVTPKVPYAYTTLTASAGGTSASVPVSVGLVWNGLSEFEDAAGWSATSWLATSEVVATPGQSRQAVELRYDFTQSAEPRVAGASPSQPITLPGQPVRLGLWVRGDAGGAQLSFALGAANGERFDVYGPAVTWGGWQYVEVDVPQGKALPLQLHGINLVQADPARQHAGAIGLDGMGVRVIR